MNTLAVLALFAATAATTSPAPEGIGVDAALALPCLGCHDARHNALDARDAEALFDALRAWRADQTSAALMSRIARGYTIEELRAISRYLAAQ